MKIYCIGIGGIGLSAVAQILHAQGHKVSGSDMNVSDITTRLNKKGITVFEKQVSGNIDESFDLVIYSEAIPQENPERKKAHELQIKQINYAEALGMISKDKKTIAITGTHGKTTVTGMLTSILLEAQMDPSIVIGSKIDLLENNNFRVGNGEIFLTEACEYRDNFHHLSPDIVLVNNLEPEHLDYFKTEENYYQSFQILLEKIPKSGKIIIFFEDLKNINKDNIAASLSILSEEQCGVCPYIINVPGKHNTMNANASAAVAKELGISDEIIRRGLENFRGTWRRFEFKGSLNGAKVYDDYGHHPTEILATLQGAREWFPDKRLIVIFQPHQYSRTRALFDEFSKSFKDANQAWITDIYQTRDTQEDIEATSAKELSKKIENTESRYIRFSALSDKIKKEADPNTVFLVMGAGNINTVFQELQFEETMTTSGEEELN